MIQWLALIRALPELIALFNELYKRAKANGKARLARIDARRLAKAIRDRDEKAISDIFAN